MLANSGSEADRSRAAVSEPKTVERSLLLFSQNRLLTNRLRWAISERGQELTVSSEPAEVLERAAASALVIAAFPQLRETDLNFIRRLRERGSPPILIVDESTDPNARLRALRVGAEEYLGQGWRPEDLWLQIEIALRRPPPAPTRRLLRIRPGLSLDETGRRLVSGKQEIPLAPGEFKLLRTLLSRRGQVVPIEELLLSTEATSRASLYVRIRSLRRKIEVDPDRPALIRKSYDRGYLLAFAEERG